jgi:hypothetical protein
MVSTNTLQQQQHLEQQKQQQQPSHFHPHHSISASSSSFQKGPTGLATTKPNPDVNTKRGRFQANDFDPSSYYGYDDDDDHDNEDEDEGDEDEEEGAQHEEEEEEGDGQQGGEDPYEKQTERWDTIDSVPPGSSHLHRPPPRHFDSTHLSPVAPPPQYPSTRMHPSTTQHEVSSSSNTFSKTDLLTLFGAGSTATTTTTTRP